MTLNIYGNDGSLQIINLHDTFITDSFKGKKERVISKAEVYDKAAVTAKSILGPLYDKHELHDIEDALYEARSRN